MVENFVYGYDISSDQYSVYGDTIVSLPNARNQHLYIESLGVSLWVYQNLNLIFMLGIFYSHDIWHKSLELQN